MIRLLRINYVTTKQWKGYILLKPLYCFVVNSIIKSILSSSAALFLRIAPHFLHLYIIT